jgi:hypothetical protein
MTSSRKVRTPGVPAYNAQVHKDIVDGIKAGMYRSPAAKAAGISAWTLSDWLTKAEAERLLLTSGQIREDEIMYPKYQALLEEIEFHEAKFEGRMIKKVVTAAESEAPNTWQAAMTLLERKHPERWGRRDTSKLVVEGGDKPIQVETRGIIFDETSRGLSRDLLRRLAAPGAGEPSGVRLGDGSADDAGEVESDAVEVPSDGD